MILCDARQLYYTELMNGATDVEFAQSVWPKAWPRDSASLPGRGKMQMPLYEYYCADCRGKFELFTSFETSEGDIVCAKCHSGRVRKMFSMFASPRGAGAFDGDDYDDGEAGGCSCGGACSCGGH